MALALRVVTIIAFAILSLASCATGGAGRIEGDSSYPFPEENRFDASPLPDAQRLISEGGRTLVGLKTLTVNGVTYPNDCTGVVRAAYAFASIDLAFRYDKYAGNGVRRIYQTLKDEGLLYAVRYPRPGDLIFWNDTYDANKNGLADDELTHIGLVVSAVEDGSIEYLHYHYGRGPVIEMMNLLRPGDGWVESIGVVNAPLRMKGSPAGPGTNAAELFRVFGMGYGLKKTAAP